MSVREFMADNAATIIDSIQKEDFSSRDFIYRMRQAFERDYIQLLYDDTSNRPMENVHQQIGRYLAEHSVELNIADKNQRDPSKSPYGEESSTELWRKTN